VRAGKLMGEIGAPQRDREEEPQSRGLSRRLRAQGHLLGLAPAQIVARRGVGASGRRI
jgi:hypothetical protein